LTLFHLRTSSRLDDTRLEPPHVPMSLVPVNGLPVYWFAGSRTSKGFSRGSRRCCHLLCLLWWFASLSRHERPRGSLLTFVRSNVAWWRNPYPPHYRAAFAFSAFLCPLLCQHSLRFAFPIAGEQWVYHVSLRSPDGDGPLFPPVALDVHERRDDSSSSRHGASLAQACQHLWLVPHNDV
jgi:hypothetical protein